jgi:hypothetical protein
VKAAYDLANSYKGTVTGVKINGTTKNPSSGVVDLGTVITAHQTLKTINGESIIGSGDVVIGGGNVQAVDTGDVLDDVTINYATTAYVDGLIGDINSVLESIINGGGSVSLITFTVEGVKYQAEEGMTWGEFIDSAYNTSGYFTYSNNKVYYTGHYIHDNRDGSEVYSTDLIEENGSYITQGGGSN